MKKKILGIIAIIAVAMIVGYNVSKSQKNDNLSNLALSNVEALADGGEADMFFCWYYGCLFSFQYDCHVYQGGRLILICENSRG